MCKSFVHVRPRCIMSKALSGADLQGVGDKSYSLLHLHMGSYPQGDVAVLPACESSCHAISSGQPAEVRQGPQVPGAGVTVRRAWRVCGGLAC